MVKPSWIEFSSAIYHVMSRGNARQKIVLDDADREKRLDCPRRTVETHGWLLHAFALMSNHDHLFVETPESNLSAGMQYLNGSYASYFNWRHGRSRGKPLHPPQAGAGQDSRATGTVSVVELSGVPAGKPNGRKGDV